VQHSGSKKDVSREPDIEKRGEREKMERGRFKEG
jgi:hypothetical protein